MSCCPYRSKSVVGENSACLAPTHIRPEKRIPVALFGSFNYNICEDLTNVCMAKQGASCIAAVRHGQKLRDSIDRQQTPGESWIMGILRNAANLSNSESQRPHLIGYKIISITGYLRGQSFQIGNDCHNLIRGFRRKAFLFNGKYCAWTELQAACLERVFFGLLRKKSASIFHIKPVANEVRSNLHVHPAPLDT